ncbi:EpsG family protein [Flavobacterium limnophilum]|uniref:EpsG family protein n=1 Tax=Flavobacterium limnophilum TaxID=3003262 RepID=UPI00248222A5|nr:EpsG family protein [Flavobacterium limnophilum]
MMFYILFILLISGILSLEHFYPNKQIIIGFFAFCIVVLVAGFRDRIGYDYDSYVSWYLTKTRDDDFEFGFVVIMNLFRVLHLEPHFLFFFFSFFTCFFLFLGIKKYTENQSFAFMIFLLLPELFLTSFHLVRQSFSVAICFYAFYYLMNKKYFIYLTLMFVAVSIHYSAFLPLLIYFFVFKYPEKFNERNIIVMLLISFLISKINSIQLFYFLFEKTRYAYYFSQESAPVNNYKIIILNLVALFVLFHFRKLKEKYPNHKYLLPFYFFSVIFINLFSSFADMARLVLYFRIFEIIIIADLVFLFAKKKRLWLVTGFYIYYFAAFTYTLRGDLEKTGVGKFIPYQTFILK